jgi:FHA domain-containing protein
MGVFDRVEKKLENAVSGAFARAFKGDVQPVEVTARLQRELDSEAKLLSRDRKLVPNEFRIAFSTHDYDRLTPYSKTLNSEIAQQLRDYAADKSYLFNGPILIEYTLDAALPVGRFTVTSAAVAGVDAPQPVAPSQVRSGTLVVEVNGVRHPLTPPGLTIGRGTDADLRINDPGVSRLHARITVVNTDDGQQLAIEDLGSTNGITVDGQRTRHAGLRLGSRVEIGSTRLAIVSPVNDV